jgi:hypothetical protein
MRKDNIIKGLLEWGVYFIQYYDSIGKSAFSSKLSCKILALQSIYESKKIIWTAFSQQ